MRNRGYLGVLLEIWMSRFLFGKDNRVYVSGFNKQEMVYLLDCGISGILDLLSAKDFECNPGTPRFQAPSIRTWQIPAQVPLCDSPSVLSGCKQRGASVLGSRA